MIRFFSTTFRVIVAFAACLLTQAEVYAADTNWPTLPDADGSVTIQVHDHPNGPDRPLAIHLRYPSGTHGAGALKNVKASTGLMLCLHNWGGTTFEGAPNPRKLADAYDVIAIGVSYYQSGDRDSPDNVVPYDFGYLQAMDALRALQYVYRSLQLAGHPFDATRIYGCGGSGGGNVIQMANKLAPRTFACIVDLSGMASLTDDIAYNLPGGSSLNARYSRDQGSPASLAPGAQEIRDLGNAAHLAIQKKAGNGCKVIIIHGEDDPLCLAADKRRVVDAMRAAGIDVAAHFISKADIDGAAIKDSGHSIGDRFGLLQKFAGAFLSPDSTTLCKLHGACDFERREAIAFPTSDGVYTIRFGADAPTIDFKKSGSER